MSESLHVTPYIGIGILRDPLMHVSKTHVSNARADCAKRPIIRSRDQLITAPSNCNFISSASCSPRTGGIFVSYSLKKVQRKSAQRVSVVFVFLLSHLCAAFFNYV